MSRLCAMYRASSGVLTVAIVTWSLSNSITWRTNDGILSAPKEEDAEQKFFSCDGLFPPAAALFGENLRAFRAFRLMLGKSLRVLAVAGNSRQHSKQDSVIVGSGDNNNVDNGIDENNDDDDKV
uniref:Uncharacterized protein n=1 Tax=Glossina austeni TaxID=7395 RepID=A0A1A9VF74_GLOAU